MIHTFKLMYEIHYQEVQDLQRRLGINYKEVNTYFDGVFSGVTMAITNSGNGKWKLYMAVDAIELLGKPIITEDDYPLLEKELRYILKVVVGQASSFRNHVLLRIDFRYDVVLPDKNTRMLLMNLYKKQTKSYRFQKKSLGKVRHGIYCPYKTTVYHSSNSIECMVYLKQEERQANGEEVKDYEKDVIRYEVHVTQDHLYYMEKKNEKVQRPRKLVEYLKDDVYKEYFKKYLLEIYHLGDFYKIDEAREKLKHSSLSSNEKLKLIEFLKQISYRSIDTPLKKMAKGTFKSRLSLLRQVGINPILIPKNYTSEDATFKSPSYLKNPLNDYSF